MQWEHKHINCVSVLKKVKHRLVENMSSGTADALGLSRAILCNGEPIIRGSVDILPFCISYISSQKIYLLGYVLDGLVKKLEELEKTAELYKGKSVLYFCRFEVFTKIHRRFTPILFTL